MSKWIKYTFWVIAGLLVVFFSFDIKKTNGTEDTQKFDVNAYTDNFWDNKLPAIEKEAPDLSQLIKAIRTDQNQANNEYGHKLGISSTIYYMAKGSGVIDSAGNENIDLVLGNGTHIKIATGFIFGNAVRDGSGLVNIDDFLNITDFNNVSLAINKIVREKVADSLKNAKPGMQLSFTGAFEINEKHADLTAIRIIPVQAILHQESHE